MRKALWPPVLVGLLVALALVAGACVKPRPTPIALGPTSAGSPKNLPTAVIIATSAPTATQATNTPTTEGTPAQVVEGQATPTAAEVVVVEGALTPGAEEPTTEPTVGPGGEPPAATEVTYVVRWGDTLSKIAERYGTTITAIVERNPQITDRNRVVAGTTIIIPAGSTVPETGGEQGTGVAPETGVYTVQRGDTLASIARRFGTTVAALLQANPSITNRNQIWSGQQIIIPAGGEWTTTRTHTVRYGETLAYIARLYNTTIWAIKVRNNIANTNLIYPGQVLVIP